MKIQLQLEKGYLPASYGKFADSSAKYKGQPVVSFPLEVTEIPEAAQYLALYLIDYDAVPVCGFPWIHWTVANIPLKGNQLVLPENFSQTAPADIIQGKNSLASPFVGETDTRLTQHYVGPTPPDKDHVYSLAIYALSEKLPLSQGFWLNELLSINPSLIAETTFTTFRGKAK